MAHISRREGIIASVAALVTIPLVGGAANEPYADPAIADEWLRKWEAGKRAAHGMLNLTRFADPVYVLTKDIAWTPNDADAKVAAPVTVPVGFVTDFASIPRAFWALLRPDGDYCYAAILHDYLYWEQQVPREKADNVLRLAMKDFEVGAPTISTIYNGVRAGGGIAWKQNRKLRKSGEKRLLKRLPDDPTIRWVDWKKRADVF
jgi:hypothetical protein